VRKTWMYSLLIVLFLAALDQTSVATALPAISLEFGTDAALSWVMSAYLVAAAISTPWWGKVSDILDRKKILLTSVAIFLTGSVLASAAPTLEALIAARALQGIGGGGMVVLSFATVASLVTPRERGRYVGLFGAVFGLASIVGPVLGGVLTQAISWRSIFAMNILVGITAFIFVMLTLRTPSLTTRGAFDWRGGLLLILAIGGVTFGLVGANPASGWPAVVIAAFLILGALSTVAFFLVEQRAQNPMLSLKILTHPVIRITASLGLIVGAITLAVVVYTPAFLQGAQGSTPVQSGLKLLPFVVSALVASIIAGRRISSAGTYTAGPILGSLLAVAGLLLLSRLQSDSPYLLLAIGLTLSGLGVGAVIPALTAVSQSAVDAADLGVATSTASLARALGSAFGATTFGILWSLAYNSSSTVGPNTIADQAQTASATSLIFLVGSVVMAVAFLLALRLPSIELRSHHATNRN
jgi:EmrB/QacA subfamily drug resistance transporter